MKEYSLVTLDDVFNKVPADRIRDCLDELGAAFVIAKEMADEVGVITFRPEGQPYVWMDDGKRTLDITLEGVDGKPVAKTIAVLED